MLPTMSNFHLRLLCFAQVTIQPFSFLLKFSLLTEFLIQSMNTLYFYVQCYYVQYRVSTGLSTANATVKCISQILLKFTYYILLVAGSLLPFFFRVWRRQIVVIKCFNIKDSAGAGWMKQCSTVDIERTKQSGCLKTIWSYCVMEDFYLSQEDRQLGVSVNWEVRGSRPAEVYL